MAPLDYVAYVKELRGNNPVWNSMFPPATPEQIDTVKRRAVAELGAPLNEDYLQLIELLNGGGKSVCFYRTDTRQVQMLGRNLTDRGVVEQNLIWRRCETTDDGEIAYAHGDGLIFLPCETGQTWIGRDMTTRQILWRPAPFYDLVRYAYSA